MNNSFHQQAQIMMAKHIDSHPLLKISRLLDWQPIKQLLNLKKIYIRDHRGRPAYPLLSIFKIVLPDQHPRVQPFRTTVGRHRTRSHRLCRQGLRQ